MGVPAELSPGSQLDAHPGTHCGGHQWRHLPQGLPPVAHLHALPRLPHPPAAAGGQNDPGTPQGGHSCCFLQLEHTNCACVAATGMVFDCVFVVIFALLDTSSQSESCQQPAREISNSDVDLLSGGPPPRIAEAMAGLQCVIAIFVVDISPTRMLKTDCFRGTRLASHVPSSS